MNIEPIAISIHNRHFEQAANIIVKNILKDKIQEFRKNRVKSDRYIAQIARSIEKRYMKLLRIDNGLTLLEKAEQVYMEIYGELSRSVDTSSNLLKNWRITGPKAPWHYLSQYLSRRN
jgi:hypothetical protein